MKPLLYLFLGSVLLSSCQDIWMNEVPINNQNEIVKEICAEVESNFVFFEQKGIEWKSITNKYDSLSANRMSDNDFFKLLSSLLSELKDGHTSLYTGFNQFLYYDLFLLYLIYLF